MIKINLLPEDSYKKNVSFSNMNQGYKSLILSIAAGIIGLLVIISLIVIIYPRIQIHRLNYWNARWESISGDYQKTMKLTERMKRIRYKLDNIGRIVNNRLIWSAKLNEISDALPGEIQLTGLELNMENTYKNKQADSILIISGIVPSVPGERAIEQFIKNLKQNDKFRQDFPRIEPPSTEVTGKGNKRFTLKCYLAKKYLLGKISSIPKGGK